MYSAKLFLGFPVDQEFSFHLQKVNPHLTSLFIQKSGQYLEEVNFKGVSYLGKYAENVTDSSELELLEANVYSLLKKLVPDYSYEKVPLLLFPVLNS